MSSQTSWRPDVPESQLFDERTWLQGVILSSVAYGVNLTLFTLITNLLVSSRKTDIKRNGRASRQTTCLLIYVCVMFILSTLTIASQAKTAELSYIDNRDFPGGPAAYLKLMISIPTAILGGCCSCMMNWFIDGLLLWRCSVIYKSSRISIWLIMAIPGLLLLASFVSGTIFLHSIARSSPLPWAQAAFGPGFIYSMITLTLTVILTLMIVIRLYLHRRRSVKVLGHRHGATYTSIMSMLIESAAVQIVLTIWFLIPFALRNSISNIPLVAATQVQAAASFMIIFRVAKGTAWTQTANTEFTSPDVPMRRLSHIRFPTPSAEHSDSAVTSRSRNQHSLDQTHDTSDTKSNSHGTVYESSRRDPPDALEKAGPIEN